MTLVTSTKEGRAVKSWPVGLWLSLLTRFDVLDSMAFCIGYRSFAALLPKSSSDMVHEESLFMLTKKRVRVDSQNISTCS